MLKNLTPLQCLPMDVLTPAGTKLGVVLVKLTLDLVPGDAPLRAQGFTHRLKLSQEQDPLALTDSYHGEFLNSSMRWESDTAFVKPRCDVVFLGSAHVPGNKPRRRFLAGLKVKAPDQERPVPPRPPAIGFGMDLTPEQVSRWRAQVARAAADPVRGAILVDKRIQVTGARWLKRRNFLSRICWWLVKVGTLGLVRRCPWRLTGPEPVTALPVRYEYAFGGHVRVRASEPAARRVPRRACRPGVDRAKLRQAWQQTRADALLAEVFWAENPVGRGYAPAWQLKATRTRRLPAPQLEDPQHPFTARAAWRAMLGKADGRFRAILRSQGLGVITRNWEPRLGFAGTWNQAWAASGAPYPPDHALAFNNYAHPDLQCRHLAGDETVELTNLCPPSMPGLAKDVEGNRLLRFQLPGLFPFLLTTDAGGAMAQVPLVLDTVIVEPAAGRVTLLQRASFPAEPAEVELRLAMPGEPREVRFESAS